MKYHKLAVENLASSSKPEDHTGVFGLPSGGSTNLGDQRKKLGLEFDLRQIMFYTKILTLNASSLGAKSTSKKSLYTLIIKDDLKS
jgi:hypothetical protein